MAIEKNYTYVATFERVGRIETVNERVNRARGYGQSWFKTEDAARKALANTIKIHTGIDWEGNRGKVVSWVIKDREHNIESFNA